MKKKKDEISHEEFEMVLARIKELKKLVDDGLPESIIPKGELLDLNTIISSYSAQKDMDKIEQISNNQTIRLDKNLEDATYLDLCQNTERQLQIKRLREMSINELRAIISEGSAEQFYQILSGCRDGYMKIQKVFPSIGEIEEGWTYAFGEGFPLHIDLPNAWYSTSNIQIIDWPNRLFTTMNSIYSFDIKK